MSIVERGPVPLWVRGKDAASFLHRMSTNDVATLAVGDAVDNVFTDARGRIVAHAVHVGCVDGAVLLVSGGAATRLQQWLDGYLFSEAVAMTIAGSSRCFWSGTRDVPPATTQVATLQVGDDRITYWMDETKTDDDRDAEVGSLRVDAGRPGFVELGGNYGPLEVGLEHAVSWTKGCYVGQEVVAKMDTYQKVRKRLWRVFGDVVPDMGADVMVEDQVVGQITSIAPLRSGHACALAVVKLAMADTRGARVAAVVGGHPVELRR
jgi:tRNA-modifying protein YgfZ